MKETPTWQWEHAEQLGFCGLYEAKLLHHFNHRFATFEGVNQSDAYAGKARTVSQEEWRDVKFRIKPRYWVQKSFFDSIINRYPDHSNWLVGYRDIVRATDERTCISAILPKTATTRSVLCIGVPHPEKKTLLVGNLSSFCFDYATRQKVPGTHLSWEIFKQLPILAPQVYAQPCLWDTALLIGSWIIPRVLELTYTALDLEPFAKDCGYDGLPFVWDEQRRFLLRCELDAAYFHLYGIAHDDVDYIMETFHIVKRKDEAQFGEYRTKRVILDLYNAMQQAITTGAPYRTRLDPPPADPRVAHEAKEISTQPS